MNKIIVNHGSFKVKELELEHGTLTVGRATDNDLKLDDSAVSSHHAKLVTFFNVTYIEDLNSTNGTLVNGRPVKKYTLHTGDIVLLGKHQLLFQGARLEDANSDSTIVMTASEKKDALATAAEIKKPAVNPNAGAGASTNAASASPYRTSNKVPMKQDHAEPVGRLHEGDTSGGFQRPIHEPAGGYSPAVKPTPTPTPTRRATESAQAFARHEANPGISNPANATNAAFAESATSAAVIEKKDAARDAASMISTPVAKPEMASELAIETTSDAKSGNSNSAVAKPNPFQAAFPEDSADKIDINDVPSIGKLSDNEMSVTPSKAAESTGDPDSSSANLYNVQALSQAAEKKPLNANFRANIPVDGDESLLIPAFAKKLSNPDAPKFSYANNVSDISNHTEHKISPEVEKLFEEEEKANKAKASRMVLEDPSVNLGEDFQPMTPVGISESNRINQYQKRAAAAAHDIPAVGDRTLLKQIITGDRDFSPSRNKFEVIQIVLGVVIFVIIALIAVASL